jgi:hypothetical protein
MSRWAWSSKPPIWSEAILFVVLADAGHVRRQFRLERFRNDLRAVFRRENYVDGDLCVRVRHARVLEDYAAPRALCGAYISRSRSFRRARRDQLAWTKTDNSCAATEMTEAESISAHLGEFLIYL